MSKLNDLIKELCPDGVEYKKLGSFTKILRGKRLTKNLLSDEYEFCVYHGGLEPLGKFKNYNRNENTVMIINVGASAGTIGFCKEKFWSSDGCFCVENNDSFSSRYLYYYLSNNENYFQSKVRKAGIPTLDASVVENYIIPLPPLPVQCEIVRILDNFTALTSALTSALTAELTAQRKRYSGFLNSLLSFEGRDAQDGVLWKKLGDAVGIKRGVRVVKAQLNEVGEYPVYQNSLTALGNYNYFNCNANKTFLITAGAAGEIGYSYVPFWAADDCYYFECNDSGLMERYLYYALKTRQYKLKRMVRNASVPRLGRYSIENLLIPVPSLEEQQRIVDILDRFDKLCNDLSEGLPAEIAARQKQYEYYRDKLLTFKEKEA